MDEVSKLKAELSAELGDDLYSEDDKLAKEYNEEEDEEIENPEEEVDEEELLEEEDSIEEKARSLGWDPNKGEKSAAEFVRNAPLYDKIKQQSKEMNNLRESLKGVTDLLKTSQVKQFNSEYSSLEEQKRSAIEMGDYATCTEIEKRMKQIDQEKIKYEQQFREPITNKSSEEIQRDFMSAHSFWVYGKDVIHEDMRAYSDGRYNIYKNQGLSEAEAVTKVSDDMLRMFSSEFGGTQRGTNKSSVAPGSTADTKQGKSKDGGWKSLTKEQKTICRTLVSTGTMTVKEYVAELQKRKLLRGQK